MSDPPSTAGAPWSEEFEAALREHLPYLGEEPLLPDAPLADLGLDSMATIALLLTLEPALGVEFPDELLVEETFATAGALWSAAMSLARR